MSGIVQNAISLLKHLEEGMREEGTNFKPEDIENCDIIADLLQELEFEVKKLHEELETETIKSSVYRHKLVFFEDSLKKEIQDNVLAARDSNLSVILKLNEELDSLSRNISILHEQDKDLTDKIALMKPERKALKQTHENTVMALNKNMSNKAEAQIKLNETRDLLRDTNKDIADLEEEMFILRDNLLKEKADARDEKKRLEDEKAVSIGNAASQEEYNSTKNKEVEAIKTRYADSSKNLRLLYRDNEKLEQTIKELDTEIETGSQTLQEEQAYLESIIAESLKISNDDLLATEEHSQTKADLTNRVKKVTEKSKQEAENLKQLKEIQDKKKEELKLVFQSFKELQTILETSKKYQDDLRMKISKVLEDQSNLESVNEEIYKSLSESQQAHNQFIDSSMREAEELREQLAYERETRLKNQQLREQNLVDVEKFNDDTIIEQTNANKYLNLCKEKYNSLIEKELNYTKDIKINEEKKDQLTEEIKQLTEKFDSMKSILGEKVNKLEADNNYYENENNQMSNEINEISPVYQKLCKDFADKTREHNDLRQLLIKAKSRKNMVEDNITKIEAQIVSNDKSREKNQLAITDKRSWALKQLKEQNSEIKVLESEILDTGLKAQTIKEQNDKFVQAIQDIELQFESMDNEMDESEQNEKILQEEYDRLNMDLIYGWVEDDEVEKIFEKKDLELTHELKDIFTKSKERERGVNYVTNRMSKEIEDLDNYLNVMIGKLGKDETNEKDE